ncbi:hypothetical protein ALC57_00134 [Trachymyrmex cornetzi]|uniref:Uncharacterized protein n=1 Tax=Trachymyrmex cornetzi TaxID=471704 RepID=A0A151K2Z5_9HYME|nr:hypothetical protein ALC57_00134 [Trachymyrmex cornetzi]
MPSAPDLLWLYGKCTDLPGILGWNGFIIEATNDKNYSQSFVSYLPFVNAPPTNYDTTYTVLVFASEKCKQLNQHTCFVTFDQPLYIKAKDIISSENSNLSNVIVRLGGFHLLMSFMGSIGYIMEGSGLKELFSTIYAVNSIDKMMTGHAYARALRAHTLTHLALAKIILQLLYP